MPRNETPTTFRTVALVLCDNDYENTLRALLETLKRATEWNRKITRAQASLMVMRGAFSHAVVYARPEGETVEQITCGAQRAESYLMSLRILFDEEAENAILTCDHETGSWYYEVQSGVIAPFCEKRATPEEIQELENPDGIGSDSASQAIFSLAKWKADNDGKIPSHAWPGGYPLYYVTADGGTLSPKAVIENEALCSGDDPQWSVVAVQTNYEDTELYCDHTGERIDAAYE